MIPEAFLSRMEKQLGSDYCAFRDALDRPAVRALRVNTRKIAVEDFLRISPFALRSVPYTRDGFYFDAEGRIGAHPYHHAGMFYVQDPGAMATVEASPVIPGWRVLDVCASPGGKSAQLAAMVGDEGLLWSNEIDLSRCRVLGGNLERLGIPNAVVSNTDAETLASWFDGFFHLVLVDAPCSGEGMFRKYDIAVSEWSTDNVTMCAERQRKILSAAAKTVRPGGYLLYSTCTFSEEENEGNVAAFLSERQDFSLCTVAPGVIPYTAQGTNMPEARRFYPHIAPGEGQFFALLRRREDATPGTGICFRDAAVPLSKKDGQIVFDFLRDTLVDLPAVVPKCVGDSVVLPAAEIPANRIFSAGVTVGSLQKGRVEPHHQFFMAFGRCFRRQIRLSAQDPRTVAYLRGETIPAPETENGWCAVTVDGCTLGGAKVVDGVAKNHYPKGLRQK